MQYQQHQQHYAQYDNYAYSQPTPEHIMYQNDQQNAYNMDDSTGIPQVTVPDAINNIDETDSPVLRALLSNKIPSASTTPLTNHVASSPITNYIEGISTPPQSPNEAAIEHVNHMSNILDASSQSDYSQNASDGKCRMISFIFILYLKLFNIIQLN